MVSLSLKTQGLLLAVFTCLIHDTVATNEFIKHQLKQGPPDWTGCYVRVHVDYRHYKDFENPREIRVEKDLGDRVQISEITQSKNAEGRRTKRIYKLLKVQEARLIYFGIRPNMNVVLLQECQTSKDTREEGDLFSVVEVKPYMVTVLDDFSDVQYSFPKCMLKPHVRKSERNTDEFWCRKEAGVGGANSVEVSVGTKCWWGYYKRDYMMVKRPVKPNHPENFFFGRLEFRRAGSHGIRLSEVIENVCDPRLCPFLEVVSASHGYRRTAIHDIRNRTVYYIKRQSDKASKQYDTLVKELREKQQANLELLQKQRAAYPKADIPLYLQNLEQIRIGEYEEPKPRKEDQAYSQFELWGKLLNTTAGMDIVDNCKRLPKELRKGTAALAKRMAKTVGTCCKNTMENIAAFENPLRDVPYPDKKVETESDDEKVEEVFDIELAAWIPVKGGNEL